MASSSDRPRRRGQVVVERVLQITLDQLAEVGFARLSIPEVARQAGLNKTSVYRRWPTKVDLVRDALTHAVAETQEAPDTGSLRDDLRAAAGTLGRFLETPRGKGPLRVLVAEGGHPDVRGLVASSPMARQAGSLYLIIQRAIERGEVPPHTDGALLLYVVAGALIHRVFVEQASVDDAYVNRVVDLVLFGVFDSDSAARKSRGGAR